MKSIFKEEKNLTLDHFYNYLFKQKTIKTGIENLDENLEINTGCIYSIGSYTGVGKSTLLQNICLSMALTNPKYRLMYVTGEETALMTLLKFTTTLSGDRLSTYYNDKHSNSLYLIEDYLRSGKTNIPEIETAKAKLSELIDYKSHRRISLIDSAKKLHDILYYLESNLELLPNALFIDSFNNLGWSEDYKIINELKDFAKDNDIAIIGTFQLDSNNQFKHIPSIPNIKKISDVIIKLNKYDTSDGFFSELRLSFIRPSGIESRTDLVWDMRSRKIY